MIVFTIFKINLSHLYWRISGSAGEYWGHPLPPYTQLLANIYPHIITRMIFNSAFRTFTELADQKLKSFRSLKLTDYFTRSKLKVRGISRNFRVANGYLPRYSPTSTGR